MHAKCEYIASCPLRHTLEVLRKKWSLLIINVIGYHERLRFSELMGLLIDISPKALSDTLKELEAEGLVSRESFAEIPPRVEYMLTEDGSELREEIVIPLLRWAAARNGRSTGLHQVCQRMPFPMWLCPESDCSIEPG